MFQLHEGLRITGVKGTYQIEQFLGRGGGGSVMKCMDLQTQEKYAIKQIPLSYQGEGLLVQKLMGVDFQHVVKFKEVFQIPNDAQNFFIIMEYCNGYSLYDQIYNQKLTFTEQEAASIILQVAKGIQELNQQNIIHRDIKPENIMGVKTGCKKKKIFTIYEETQLDSKYKICDLGTSKQAESTKTKAIGTSYYLAPEMLTDNPNAYGQKVDVWALGLVLYEIIIGQPYFEGSTWEYGFRDFRLNCKIYATIEGEAHTIQPCNQGLAIQNYHSKCQCYTNTIKRLNRQRKFKQEKLHYLFINQESKQKKEIRILNNNPQAIPQQQTTQIVQSLNEDNQKQAQFQSGQQQIIQNQIIINNINNHEENEESNLQKELILAQQRLLELIAKQSKLTSNKLIDSSNMLHQQTKYLNQLQDTYLRNEQHLNNNKSNLQAVMSQVKCLEEKIDQQEFFNQQQEQQIKINQQSNIKISLETELKSFESKSKVFQQSLIEYSEAMPDLQKKLIAVKQEIEESKVRDIKLKEQSSQLESEYALLSLKKDQQIIKIQSIQEQNNEKRKFILQLEDQIQQENTNLMVLTKQEEQCQLEQEKILKLLQTKKEVKHNQEKQAQQIQNSNTQIKQKESNPKNNNQISNKPILTSIKQKAQEKQFSANNTSNQIGKKEKPQQEQETASTTKRFQTAKGPSTNIQSVANKETPTRMNC